jgi:hypothetical protein
MSAPAARERAKGFVLVLVVDQSQVDDEYAALARVCVDFDVGADVELQDVIRDAADRACNQLTLGEAFVNLLRRGRAARN